MIEKRERFCPISTCIRRQDFGPCRRYGLGGGGSQGVEQDPTELAQPSAEQRAKKRTVERVIARVAARSI